MVTLEDAPPNPNINRMADLSPLFSLGVVYVSKILDWLFGIDIISVDDAISIFQQAIKTVDTDSNGYLNIRELITIFKRMCKNDGNGRN